MTERGRRPRGVCKKNERAIVWKVSRRVPTTGKGDPVADEQENTLQGGGRFMARDYESGLQKKRTSTEV